MGRLARAWAFATLALALAPGLAIAQDWRAKFPVVSMSAVSSESQGATEARFRDFAKVFRDRFGVELRVVMASSYAATIQALTAGQIQFATLGPAAYAAAWIDSDGGVEPVAAAREVDGDVGYHSHLIVRSDSSFRSLEDLKGRSLAWADPNSASGYLIPLVSLRAAGVEATKPCSPGATSRARWACSMASSTAPSCSVHAIRSSAACCT